MSMSPAPRGQNARNIALRYLFFTLGLLINSFGIAFIPAATGGVFLYLNGIAQNHAAICCQTGRLTSQRMSGTNSSAGK